MAAGAALILTMVVAQVPAFGDQALSLLLIGGTVTFIFLISVLVLIFKRLNLTDKRMALGLPEGSIRAIIALMLILLFFVLVISLYFSGRHAVSPDIRGLTQAQVNAIPGDQLVLARRETDGTYTVRRTLPVSEESNELARQAVTTVSTLVVAISSFYFATAAAADNTRRRRRLLGGGSAATNTVVDDAHGEEDVI